MSSVLKNHKSRVVPSFECLKRSHTVSDHTEEFYRDFILRGALETLKSQSAGSVRTAVCSPNRKRQMSDRLIWFQCVYICGSDRSSVCRVSYRSAWRSISCWQNGKRRSKLNGSKLLKPKRTTTLHWLATASRYPPSPFPAPLSLTLLPCSRSPLVVHIPNSYHISVVPRVNNTPGLYPYLSSSKHWLQSVTACFSKHQAFCFRHRTARTQHTSKTSEKPPFVRSCFRPSE